LSRPRTAGRAVLLWAPFAATTAATRSQRVAAWEHRATRRLNRLPDRWHAPIWTVMQSGSLAAPLVAAAAALAAHRPWLGLRLARSGLSAYVLAKVVKRAIRRGRPADLVSGIGVRGRPAGGAGYVSGHAAVSMALACEAYRWLGRPALPLPLVVAPLVGTARVYVGAHLPLDVLGGAALGCAVCGTFSAPGQSVKN
jgi:membrane-associated phospholipid phosphatase